MRLEHTDRIRRFNVDEFVSYQTEEDLTPTAEELLEEIPEHLMPVGPTEEELAEKAAKPRRGKGYLRAEITDSESTAPKPKTGAPEPPEDDFGAGLDDVASTLANPLTSDSDGDQRTESNEGSDAATSAPGKKRRRRRRRRGRAGGRREGDQNESTSESAVDSDEGLSDPSAGTESENQNSADAGDGDNKPGKTGRKRRRRRRRRGKGGAGGDAPPSEPPTAE